MTKPIESIEDLTPDPANANTGTARGLSMVESSLREYGAGRSILADRNGVIIAGNKTHEVAAAIGLPVRVVQTDGHELVVVQRTDLSLADDAAAKGLAIADNRSSEVGLAWDPRALMLAGETVDLGAFFRADELAEILAPEAGTIPDGGGFGVAPSVTCPHCGASFTPD